MDIDEIQKKYETLGTEEKKFIYDLFQNEDKFSERYAELSKIVFKKTPPTPEEFLDPKNGWISHNFAKDIREWVRDDFLKIVKASRNITIVSMYGATRLGKSYLARLLILYIIVYAHHLRDPNAFWGMSTDTTLRIFILSFKYEKVHEVYLEPLYKNLEDCPNFIQVKFQDEVARKQKEIGISKIVYSKASIGGGHITLASRITVASGNDNALSIIGSNILCAFISEIAYFIEDAGTSEEEIFRLYSDVRERIIATVGRIAHLSFTYLDTSANNAESLIEKHILNDLQNREDVFFRWRRRWDIKELAQVQFPVWLKTKETFPVCIGDGTFPAKILENNSLELKEIPPHLIAYIPVDSRTEFQTNLLKSIKDIAGYPTTSESKLIQNGLVIESIFDNPYLENIESLLIADSKQDPEGLLWNLVGHKFFFKYNGKDWIIKRAQKEVRWIGVDLAYSVQGDIIGVSCGHKEWSEKRKEVVYVTDFCFCVGPGENGINLQSIGNFVHDLSRYGKLRIMNVLTDTFQSETLVQYLQRCSISVQKQSVDTDINPYLDLYGLILDERFKSGKNIFLKNNLHSLYRARVKTGDRIDHTKGSTYNLYNGDWERSQCGINAKDASDSVAHWIHDASKTSYQPTAIYEKENQKAYENFGIGPARIEQVASLNTKELFDRLHKKPNPLSLIRH